MGPMLLDEDELLQQAMQLSMAAAAPAPAPAAGTSSSSSSAPAPAPAAAGFVDPSFAMSLLGELSLLLLLHALATGRSAGIAAAPFFTAKCSLTS